MNGLIKCNNAVKVLHMADLHIGRKFKSLPPRKAAIREAEILITLEDTLQRFGDADIVLLSGDIFEEDAPQSSIDFVCNLFSQHENKKFFLSCGNHDCRESAAIKYFVSKKGINTHVFSEVMEQIILEDIGVVIFGISFAAPGAYASLINGFQCSKSELPCIMVIHGDVGCESAYNPISVSDIRKTGMDYLALGHIHGFSGILNIGGTYYAYPGVMEPGGFDEQGDCGVIYGTVGKNKVNLDFVPVSKRQYHNFNVDVSRFKSNEELISSLRKMIERDNLYKINLTGAADFPVDITMYKDVLEAFYIEIYDSTISTRSILSFTGENSFRGKTALSILELKNSCSEDVFGEACDILTNLMCKD